MHVVVTGASSGIGAAVARAYADTGAELTLVARREAKLEEVAEECGPDRCDVRPYDLTDIDGLDAFVDGIRDASGDIDVLVNNAGVSRVGRWNEADPSRTRTLMAVNLSAPIRLMELVAPAMCERGSGSIVNVSSVAALAFPPYTAHYNASKSGIAAASESLRPELAPDGVDVLTVYPGPVRTALADSMESGFQSGVSGMLPWGEADELAERIVRAAEKGSARLVYPRFYYLCRWFPMFTRFATAMASSRIDPDETAHT